MIFTPHERGTSVRILQFHSKTVSFRIMLCLFELGQEVLMCVCVCDKILLLLYNINQQVHLYNQIF